MCDRETVEAELRATKDAVKPTSILSVTRIEQPLAVVAHLSEGSAATGKIVARPVAKPRQLKLLGDQLVAVDENQTTRVERDRPSARGANYTITDIHCLPRQIAEILDHSAADLAVRARIHTHPHIHRHGAVAGIASRPVSAFHPSSHPSSP